MKRKNHVNHAQLSFSCSAGAANVNVFTGRVLFESPDVSIGVNSYEVGISHIYDSQSDESTPMHAGKGWKLNVQQYIKQSGTDYTYVDSYGYAHTLAFFATANGYNKYADKTGLGLVLWVSSSQCFIQDGQGGRMYFSLSVNGVRMLTKTVSGLNQAIAQKIDYTDGKIKSVYDERTPDRKFVFEYNTSGLLLSIECAKSSSKVEYGYDAQDNLISVKKTITSACKYDTSYSYSGNKLRYAAKLEDSSCLMFTYDDDGRAVSVSDGIIKTEFNFSEPTPVLFASDSLFTGTGKYSGQQERKFLGFSLTDDFTQNDGSAISFGSSQTTVTNGKGIKTTYFFNEQGFVTGLLEKADGNKYKTLFKQTGKDISIASGGSTYINGSAAASVVGSYEFPQDKCDAAKAFFALPRNKGNVDYVLSFWAKLERLQPGLVKAKLCMDCEFTYKYKAGTTAGGDTVYHEDVYSKGSIMDGSARGGWQYVTVPFKIDDVVDSDCEYPIKSERRKITEIRRIEFEGLSGPIAIADVHITPGSAPSLIIKSSEDDSYIDLADVTSIKLGVGGGIVTKAINQDFFMTESDVAATALEMCKSRFMQVTPYDLIYNGGTARLSGVSSTNFIGGKKSVSLTSTFELDNQNNNTTVYMPNYESVSGTSESGSVVKTAYAFTAVGGEAKINYIRRKTQAHVGDVTCEECEWQNAFGASLKSVDAYGIVTECTYDNYGNLIKTAVISSDKSEKIENMYIFDAKGETTVSASDGVSGESPRESFNIDPIHGTLNSSGQCALGGYAASENSYAYNGFKDKLQSVQLKVNGVVYGENRLTYNDSGRLEKLSPSNGTEYEFKYDGFGRATSYSLNGVALLTKEYDAKNNMVTANYRRSESIVDKIVNNYDNYGRLKSMVLNGGTLLDLTYEDESDGFEESSSCANIRTKRDTCNCYTYTYDYDEYNGRPKGYTVTDDSSVEKMKVYPTGDNKLAFEINGFNCSNFETIIRKNDMPLSQRVIGANDGGYESTFTYDNLGRLSECKHEDSNIIAPSSILAQMTYKQGTALKSKISYTFGNNFSSKSENISQTYDERGNITQISQNNKTSRYTYDDLNRLKEEDNEAGGFKRRYTYDEEGNVKSITQDSKTTTFAYDAGRLKSISETNEPIQTIEYDLFGNPTKYKGTKVEWTRGTLMASFGDVGFTYDSTGKLVKKTSASSTEEYKEEYIEEYIYDGDKLLAKRTTFGNDRGTTLRFLYDLEGVVGFTASSFSTGSLPSKKQYWFLKDCQGNITGLISNSTVHARYVYDAWGKCSVVDTEISDDNAALLNPFRWKGQLYDQEIDMYLIGGRWYDPSRCGYISSDNPEALLENAGTVFALNLYAITAGNPVAGLLAMCNLYASLDFYYDNEYKTWWEKFGNWVLFGIGVAATLVACIAAPFTCGGSTPLVSIGLTLAKIALGTVIGAAISLAIGGTIAGIQGALSGHGFWQAFAEHVSGNVVEALVTSFAFSAVSVAASNITKCFQCFKEGTLVSTADGQKAIEEIREGDLVLAYDEETGETAYKRVTHLFRNETNEWYKIRVNGEEITCTAGHPFYLPAIDKFIPAEQLEIGENLLLSNGEYGIIESIEVDSLETPETTYNLEVEDYHTYYVGNNEVLVHNICKGELKQDASIARDIEGEGKYGSYEIMFDNGKGYVGKGDQNRMWTSASRITGQNEGLKVTSVKWRPAANNRAAFIQEAEWMNKAWDSGIKLYNKNLSPGFKYGNIVPSNRR